MANETAKKTLKTRIKLKRDTSANWEKANPVLLNGETIIVDTANNETRTKTGDGTKTYTQLPFDDEGTKGGKGLSTCDYTVEDKAEVAKVKNKANSSDVLTKTNTIEFTPTADYQPATKKYVDSKSSSVSVTVSVPVADWTTKTDSHNVSYHYRKVTAIGVIEAGQPIIDVVLPSDDIGGAEEALEAYQCLDRVVTGDGYVELYCFGDTPIVAFNMRMLIVR